MCKYDQIISVSCFPIDKLATLETKQVQCVDGVQQKKKNKLHRLILDNEMYTESSTE